MNIFFLHLNLAPNVLICFKPVSPWMLLFHHQHLHSGSLILFPSSYGPTFNASMGSNSQSLPLLLTSVNIHNTVEADPSLLNCSLIHSQESTHKYRPFALCVCCLKFHLHSVDIVKVKMHDKLLCFDPDITCLGSQN